MMPRAASRALTAKGPVPLTTSTRCSTTCLGNQNALGGCIWPTDTATTWHADKTYALQTEQNCRPQRNPSVDTIDTVHAPVASAARGVLAKRTQPRPMMSLPVKTHLSVFALGTGWWEACVDAHLVNSCVQAAQKAQQNPLQCRALLHSHFSQHRSNCTCPRDRLTRRVSLCPQTAPFPERRSTGARMATAHQAIEQGCTERKCVVLQRGLQEGREQGCCERFWGECPESHRCSPMQKDTRAQHIICSILLYVDVWMHCGCITTRYDTGSSSKCEHRFRRCMHVGQTATHRSGRLARAPAA